jgi:hypothetical protein
MPVKIMSEHVLMFISHRGNQSGDHITSKTWLNRPIKHQCYPSIDPHENKSLSNTYLAFHKTFVSRYSIKINSPSTVGWVNIPSFLSRKPACIPLLEQEWRTAGNSACWKAVKEQVEAAEQSAQQNKKLQRFQRRVSHVRNYGQERNNKELANICSNKTTEVLRIKYEVHKPWSQTSE